MNVLSPISRRVAAATLLVSIVASLLIATVQLVQSHREGVAALRASAASLQAKVAPELAESLWMIDTPRTALLLDALAATPGVAWLRLRADDGQVLQRGTRPEAPVARATIPLVHHAGRAFSVGTLEVQMDDRALVAQLRARAVSRAVGLFIALGLSAACILLLFHHWVTRHLRAIAAYARDAGPDTLHVPLVLDRRARRRPDEFDEMVGAFNRMRETMRDDLARRTRDAAELQAHRERLEELVDARTRELRAAVDTLEAQRDAIARLANTDALTGVSSRRHFEQQADAALDHAEATGAPLSLLMVDIDHFKRINDTHGHSVGDLVLVEFARTCMAHLPPGAVMGRLGGEEFAIVLPDTDLAGATARAERLRKAVSLAPARLAGQDPVFYTASLGVAAWRPGMRPVLPPLLRQADIALYQAKSAGRDRVAGGVPVPVDA